MSVTPSVTVYLGDILLGDCLGGGDLGPRGVIVLSPKTTGNCSTPWESTARSGDGMMGRSRPSRAVLGLNPRLLLSLKLSYFGLDLSTNGLPEINRILLKVLNLL